MKRPFKPFIRATAATTTAAVFFLASTLTFAQDTQPVVPGSAPSDEAQQQQAPESAQPEPAPYPNQPDANQAPPYTQQAPPYTQQAPPYTQQAPPYTQQAPPYAQQAPPYAQQGPYVPQAPAYGQQAPPQWNQPAYNGPQYSAPQYPAGQPYAQHAPPPIPAQLTIAPGTYVTVRINQMLSSDKSHQGDAFTATLVDPVVVNGVVVAEPGQTIGGTVADVKKGDPAQLQLRLTDLTLVDGQQIPVDTTLVARRGPGFNGRDAGTMVGTTALGTIVGGAVGWGTGAAIGAGAGLLLGAIVTHHHASVVYPEQILTFRIQNSPTFTTQNAPQAFHYIEPGEYADANSGPPPARPYYATAAPSPYYYGYGYPYPYYYPYWWGPTFGFAYWGGPHYYWRGYYRGPVYHGRAAVRR